MDLSRASYQNALHQEGSSSGEEEEQEKLLDGYGGVFDPETAAHVDLEDVVGVFRKEDAEMKRQWYKLWKLIGVAAMLYMAAVIAFNTTRSANAATMSNSVSDASNVELLGSSKAAKHVKKSEKMKSKAKKTEEKEKAKKEKEKEKQAAKEAKDKVKETKMEEKVKKEKEKEAEKEAKEKAKETKKIQKEKAKKEKEAAKEQKAEEKAAEKEEKEKEKEEEADKKAAEAKAKEPVPYPGCETVEVTYVKTPLPFWDHEFAANASGCHLASVHNVVENTKMSKDGLFKMSLGPEIGMSFASGTILAKTFWLGGYHFESDIDESEWTDESPWDFGLDFTNSTEGCLSSSINFTELAMLNITVEDHWEMIECETPLPAIYKCCTVFVNTTIAPEPAVPSI